MGLAGVTSVTKKKCRGNQRDQEETYAEKRPEGPTLSRREGAREQRAHRANICTNTFTRQVAKQDIHHPFQTICCTHRGVMPSALADQLIGPVCSPDASAKEMSTGHTFGHSNIPDELQATKEMSTGHTMEHSNKCNQTASDQCNRGTRRMSLLLQVREGCHNCFCASCKMNCECDNTGVRKFLTYCGKA